jgi:hypothetical protein
VAGNEEINEEQADEDADEAAEDEETAEAVTWHEVVANERDWPAPLRVRRMPGADRSMREEEMRSGSRVSSTFISRYSRMSSNAGRTSGSSAQHLIYYCNFNY